MFSFVYSSMFLKLLLVFIGRISGTSLSRVERQRIGKYSYFFISTISIRAIFRKQWTRVLRCLQLQKVLVTINVDSMLFRIFFIYLSDGCSTTAFVWAALYLYNCVPILNSSFSV